MVFCWYRCKWCCCCCYCCCHTAVVVSGVFVVYFSTCIIYAILNVETEKYAKSKRQTAAAAETNKPNERPTDRSFVQQSIHLSIHPCLFPWHAMQCMFLICHAEREKLCVQGESMKIICAECICEAGAQKHQPYHSNGALYTNKIMCLEYIHVQKAHDISHFDARAT